MVNKLLAFLLLASLMGCSTTSLQCGVDGASSYVNIQTSSGSVTENWRQMAQLCAVAQKVKENETKT